LSRWPNMRDWGRTIDQRATNLLRPSQSGGLEKNLSLATVRITDNASEFLNQTMKNLS
jgi:hypothetical protein